MRSRSPATVLVETYPILVVIHPCWVPGTQGTKATGPTHRVRKKGPLRVNYVSWSRTSLDKVRVSTR